MRLDFVVNLFTLFFGPRVDCRYTCFVVGTTSAQTRDHPSGYGFLYTCVILFALFSLRYPCPLRIVSN